MEKKEIISRLLMAMLRIVESIYSQENLDIYIDDEHYTGELSKDKILGVFAYSFSHIFDLISEILTNGSEYDVKRMFRIIQYALSEIEKEEKLGEISLEMYDAKMRNLELRLIDVIPEE